MEQNNTTAKNKTMLWLKRLGFWGFVFFLLKGLAWLAVGYWMVKK